MFKRILVIKLRNIGDVLLTTPIFRIIKGNFPSCHLAVLINKETQGVLEKNPFIDEIITFDRKIKNLSFLQRYLKELIFIRDIRRKSFDTTIDLTGGDRASIISYLSGAKLRIGMKSKGFLGKSFLYSKLLEVDKNKHNVLQNLEVIERIGLVYERPKVEIFVSEEEINWAKKFVQSQVMQIRNVDESQFLNEKFILVHPTSRWLFKCWRDDYMAEVIAWMVRNNFNVILTSSSAKGELEKINSIISILRTRLLNNKESYMERIINLSGKLNLRQLIAICSISHMFLGVDTAPMHIAAALGKPVVALFGPSGAFNWGPWDNETGIQSYTKRNGIQRFGKNIVIQRDWSCIPCGKDGCEGSKISNCLIDIKSKEVIDIISEEIKRIKE